MPVLQYSPASQDDTPSKHVSLSHVSSPLQATPSSQSLSISHSTGYPIAPQIVHIPSGVCAGIAQSSKQPQGTDVVRPGNAVHSRSGNIGGISYSLSAVDAFLFPISCRHLSRPTYLYQGHNSTDRYEGQPQGHPQYSVSPPNSHSLPELSAQEILPIRAPG